MDKTTHSDNLTAEILADIIEDIDLQEIESIYEGNDHIDLTGGFLFVDVFVKVGIFGTAGIFKVYFEHEIIGVAEFPA